MGMGDDIPGPEKWSALSALSLTSMASDPCGVTCLECTDESSVDARELNAPADRENSC